MSEEELDELEYSLDEEYLEDGEPLPEEEPPKEKKGHMLALCIVLTVIICLGGTLYGAWIAFLKADNYVPWHPDYDMVDLDYILEKDFEDITDDEFDVLYAQTGLTRAGVERCYEHGSSEVSKISTIQTNYFKEYEVDHGVFAPYVCTDRLVFTGSRGYLDHIPIEAGDIILTSSTHITGWNMGHCGLATGSNTAMQAMAYGEPTGNWGINTYFMNRTTFMVLRYVPEDEDDTTAQDAAALALTFEGEAKYSAFTGMFHKKNSIEYTQCAHLVWYSYYQFGVDLDSDGGWLVTPCDIANSPHLEVMQVFGFDPDVLWPN